MTDQVTSKLKRTAVNRAKREAQAANIISSHLVGLPLLEARSVLALVAKQLDAVSVVHVPEGVASSGNCQSSEKP